MTSFINLSSSPWRMDRRTTADEHRRHCSTINQTVPESEFRNTKAYLFIKRSGGGVYRSKAECYVGQILAIALVINCLVNRSFTDYCHRCALELAFDDFIGYADTGAFEYDRKAVLYLRWS